MKDETTNKDALPKVSKQPSEDRPLSNDEAEQVSGGIIPETSGGGTGTVGDNTIPM